MKIDLGLLYERMDARKTNDEMIEAIAKSMAEVGLINPIRVRACKRFHMGQERDAFEIIAGNHRHKAAQKLHWAQVEVTVVTDDDLHAELAMIDENLCRAELSAAERSKHTSRRKAIYVELHPETRHGAAGGRNAILGKSEVANTATSVDRFTANTAAAIGKSERSVQLDVERGEKINDDALTLITDTKLDTGKFLDQVKKVDPQKQIQFVKDALSEVLEKKDKKPKRSRGSHADSRRERFLALWELMAGEERNWVREFVAPTEAIKLVRVA